MSIVEQEMQVDSEKLLTMIAVVLLNFFREAAAKGFRHPLMVEARDGAGGLFYRRHFRADRNGGLTADAGGLPVQRGELHVLPLTFTLTDREGKKARVTVSSTAPELSPVEYLQ